MSNRLTFSLASLILVFAFIFATMPVLAHKGDATHTADHAVVKSITIKDGEATLGARPDTIMIVVEYESPSDAPTGGHAVIAGPSAFTLGSLIISKENTKPPADLTSVNAPFDLLLARDITPATPATAGKKWELTLQRGVGDSEDTNTVQLESNVDGNYLIYPNGTDQPSAPTTEPANTGSGTVKAKVRIDATPPVISPIAFLPSSGSVPDDGVYTEDFLVELEIDDSVHGLNYTATALFPGSGVDMATIALTEASNNVDFGTLNLIGTNKYRATVRLKSVKTDDPAAVEITVKVNAADKDGNKATEVTGNVKIKRTAAAPAAPENLTATSGVESVTLMWTSAAGSMYEYSKDDGTTWMDATSPQVVTGLTAGTAVMFSVRVKATDSVPAGISATATATPTAPAPVVGTITASYDDVMTTTISSGTIGANGFAVIEQTALPDLQAFFNRGGSITLDDADGVDDGVDDKGNRTQGARTVVISEILWGYDIGMRAVNPLHKGYQFIELYNTTGAAIDLADWTLTFVGGRSVPTIDIDQVSNRQGAGWNLSAGQNGHIYGTTAMNPLNRIDGVRIISMYRNINYYNIEVTHKANRTELLKQIPNGNAADSWKASKRWTNNPWVYDSRMLKHLDSYSQLPGSSVITATSVPRSPFIINEIGNSTGGSDDWIELRNVTDAEASLKNYQLSVVTSDKKDTQLFHFHDKDYKVPAKGVVLVASTHPSSNDLAAGRDISLGVNDQVLNGLTHLYVVRSFNIPDSGKTLLILRNNHEAKHLTTANQIVDVVGTLSIKDNARGTSLWPLNATGGPHGNAIDGTDDEDFRAGKVYQRNDAGGGTGEKDLAVRGYTGIGYDRFAAKTGQNHDGTPGYDNGALKDKLSNITGKVTFSEVMLPTETDTAAGRLPRATRLPQWLEVYNNSMTEAVNLNNWKLEIQNDDTEGFMGNLHGTLTLKDVIVQPNQTVLIVSDSGLNSGNFPPQRTLNVFTNSTYRRELGLLSRGEPMLNPKGFYVELRDHENKIIDQIGNLTVSRRTGLNRGDNFGEDWEMPSLYSEEGYRTSLIRIYNNGMANSGLLPVGASKTANGWRRAVDTNFARIPNITFYGNHEDRGTPGYRGGGPLPVSLSKFRPERLDDGSVVIRWITESELNNAGFNILRSETRDGELTQVNKQLIKGQGTTSERTTYTWKDSTAKPNVVYYYQIQDVSLDGQVQTLRQSRLKGNVTAAGKLTTTWGELKALQ